MLPKKVKVARYDSYDPTGDYPEDDWVMYEDVENVKDLYNFFKRIHKRVASCTNDFPLGGHVSRRSLSFFEYKWLEYDGEIYKTEIKESPPPVFYRDALNRYYNLESELNKRLPRIRKIREEKRKKDKELKRLQELKEKYEKES